MSYARHREQYIPNVRSGRYFHPALGSWVTVKVTGTDKKVCDDVVGNWKGDNGLFLEHSKSHHVVLRGKSPTYYAYDNAPTSAGAMAPPAHAMNALIQASELSPLSVKMLAKANPNVPKVLLPAMVGEMTELPGLVKSFGLQRLKDLPANLEKWFLNRVSTPYTREDQQGILRHGVVYTRWLSDQEWWYRWGRESSEYQTKLIKTVFADMSQRFGQYAAQRYIELRWAINPTIKDVSLLLSFQKYASQRIEEIRALANGESVRKKVSLGSDSVTSQLASTIIWSIGGFVETGTRQQTTTQKTWGTVRYTLSKSLFPWQRLPKFPRERDLQMEAAQQLLGLTPASFSLSAWELLPWSWLIDWFTNFGELLSLTNNRIPVEHSGMVLCRTTTTRQTAGLKVTTSGLIPMGSFLLERTTKVRAAGVIGLPLQVSYMPLFEASKIAILGSLAILRHGR